MVVSARQTTASLVPSSPAPRPEPALPFRELHLGSFEQIILLQR